MGYYLKQRASDLRGKQLHSQSTISDSGTEAKEVRLECLDFLVEIAGRWEGTKTGHGKSNSRAEDSGLKGECKGRVTGQAPHR